MGMTEGEPEIFVPRCGPMIGSVSEVQGRLRGERPALPRCASCVAGWGDAKIGDFYRNFDRMQP